MSQVQEINIQLDGISNVLKTRRFRVPPYQRSYAWEDEHVDALLADIEDAIRGGEREYFLGSLVVTGPVERRFEVVDGQQRLTTVSLLIAAIRDRFRDDGDQEAENSIRNDYLANVDRKTKDREPRLALNEVDNELYQELIEDKAAIDRAKYPRQSHARLLAASDRIRLYVDKICEASKDSEEALHEWLDYLESNLKVILVVTSDDSNAFVIFETLNDRGLELAISDLLKNYLFHRSSDKIEETKNRWLTMVATLESASDDPLIVSYLRHFAMSRYGLVREKDLFGLIKKKITSKKLALSFSTELSNNSKTYASLINTDHEYWNRYDHATRESVIAFNLLGMVQMRPLLLAILEKFEAKKVSASFKKLVSVAVRFQIVGGAGGGTLEKIYSDAARQVTEGKLTNIFEILKVFTTLPSDSAFFQAFTTATISKQSLARYYLRSLDQGSNADSEVVPSTDTDKVNLEHILPITLSGGWSKTWAPDEARAYQRRLGNMAILSTRINSTIGNDDFATKRGELKKSKFTFTKMIADSSEWTSEEINNRQTIMAEMAVKVWSVK
ncbi:DUF262 domain-containing protein [Xanthomonas hortorum]|uniref:DUF262 domain-containing protein n=1 Tax=Xanthomonas hortorum TaxID=56454 RepID=UPI0015937325|nr:DUF262 domain-containing protein [Xanthomonas hortorum]NHF68025.1 DUF262 domain-containing protein [Xanthomonas hortorum]